MIELRNVTKEYSKGNSALNGVSVKIERGEFVFIVGDSGSGKSTLIRLIMKELNPTEGTIIVNGQNLNRMKHRNIAKYRRGLGVVFQDFRLLRDRNIYENIAFALRVTETPTKVIKKKVPAALSLVGLAQKYKSFPKELSGGEAAASCNRKGNRKRTRYFVGRRAYGKLRSNELMGDHEPFERGE